MGRLGWRDGIWGQTVQIWVWGWDWGRIWGRRERNLGGGLGQNFRGGRQNLGGGFEGKGKKGWGWRGERGRGGIWGQTAQIWVCRWGLGQNLGGGSIIWGGLGQNFRGGRQNLGGGM